GAVVRPIALCRALLSHPRIALRREALSELDGRPVVLAHALAAESLCGELPLRAARGQLTHITASDASDAPRVVLCHQGYLTPAVDGIRAAGATYAFDERCDAHDPADDERNLVRHRITFPACGNALAQPIAGADTGVRALTPDRLPYVGPLPDGNACRDAYGALWRGGRSDTGAAPPQIFSPGVFVSLGHGSRGVATGPFAGELLAALWCGEPLPLPPDLVARILPIRALKRAATRGAERTR
ncbi:MAG: FAD-dependent oxidoreductase, partial [Planctomycetota bacterium]|nr:FAD-dependent oxidoreductase [Planctomycetota bacterium]